jgi:hypothetical protein
VFDGSNNIDKKLGQIVFKNTSSESENDATKSKPEKADEKGGQEKSKKQ